MDTAFLRPRLCGGRFNDGGIPLEVLPDLQALQELVVDVARCEYLRAHPDRRQVPTGFAENLKLKITAIEQGSAVAAISFAKSTETLFGETSLFEPYARRAADTIHDLIDAGHSEQPIPAGLPNESRNHLKRFGQSLRGDERIEFKSPGRDQATTLTPQTWERLLERLRVQDECETVRLRGRVPELDHDRRKFEFWPIGGSKVTAALPDSHREILIRAFNEFWDEAKILLTGWGIVNGDGKLVSLESIGDVQLLDPLDVDAQLDDLGTLRDGWLDGDGAAPDEAGLKWFSAMFADLYPADLPLPHLYPTPIGGLQAEWSLRGCEMDLEVDLKTHDGTWDESGPGDDDYELKLDLDDRRDWARFGKRVRARLGSNQ
ncbi:MAG: hypothetical protein OXN96_06665 [Bryobacterales bacterium]|nr:hypothetical protein [Bryobacterales bacterium]